MFGDLEKAKMRCLHCSCSDLSEKDFHDATDPSAVFESYKRLKEQCKSSLYAAVLCTLTCVMFVLYAAYFESFIVVALMLGGVSICIIVERLTKWIRHKFTTLVYY